MFYIYNRPICWATFKIISLLTKILSFNNCFLFEMLYLFFNNIYLEWKYVIANVELHDHTLHDLALITTIYPPVHLIILQHFLNFEHFHQVQTQVWTNPPPLGTPLIVCLNRETNLEYCYQCITTKYILYYYYLIYGFDCGQH